MSMFTMRHVLLLAAAALTTTACSSDRTHFYTLLKPDTAAPAIAGGAAFAINVQSLRVPAQVDQPELVVRQGEGELALVETRQWIAPLKDERRGARSVDRTSVGEGKGGSVRVDHGGRRVIKKN